VSSVRGAYIFDLDGTLCDCTPRARKYLEDEGRDWDAFYAHCDEDDEIPDVCEMLVALRSRGFDILFVTGRRESCREATLKWLEQHFDKDIARTEHLFMRSAEDGFRDDYVSKMRNYNKYIKDKWHVLGVFEDRDQCVRAWRDIGLTCYQVADGAY
jgi:acid phosphatase class B